MRKDEEKAFEEATQNSVDLAQQLELNIMSKINNEFVKVANNNTIKQISKSTDELRKSLETYINNVIDNMVDEFEACINEQIKATIKDMPNGVKIPTIPISEYKKEAIKDIEKYIVSKGIVLGDKPLVQFFNILCNTELKDIVNNKATLEQKLKEICHKMAQYGVKIVNYKSGAVRNIDVFVRQELLYAQKKSTQDTRELFAKENNITIFEIDAHPNARPTHQLWQGKRYDLTGKYYPTPTQLFAGNGSLNDYNCLHRAFPVWNKDDAYMYTKEQLANINTPLFEFRGKTYDGYQAKQYMRYLERNIRALKKEKILLENQGLDTKVINYKIKQKNKLYKDFCKAFGTYPRANRTRVYTA